MQDDRHHDTPSPGRKLGTGRSGEDVSPGAGDPAYGEIEQPGPGQPAADTGLPEASEQAGEGNPEPTSGDPRQRVQKPEDDEAEAPMQDGEGAGRPGRGIYSGP